MDFDASLPPPCSGRRTSSRNMWLPKWNPSGVITDRNKGILYLALSTLSVPVRAVTPEGFHLHSPTLQAEA